MEVGTGVACGLAARPAARKFPGWPGKICEAWKSGIIFQSPELFENKPCFLIFMGILTIICIKRVMPSIKI